MTHTPFSGDAHQPEKPGNNTPKEPLIQVHPGEQLTPGASERCPVCGQPYAEGGAPVRSTPQASASATAGTAEQAASSGQHSVIRCARCGTYSVGTLRPSPTSPKEE